jgi:hyperosmotically inducible periplasmic protein
MKSGAALTVLALLAPCCFGADEVSSFSAYVDSDLCARLMLGPITAERVQCSQSTFKDGAQAVLVRLRNNMVLTVNKEKMIGPLMGQLAEVNGKVKAKDGTVKLESVKPITDASIPHGDPARRLLDVRTYKTDRSAQLHEKIRHELAMMPYISNFDFISFTQNGSDVILSGWTVRETNRDTAGRVVRDIDGVENVVNNIEVLPLGSFDMQIRAGARAALQRTLSRYFWGNGSDIKIIVKRGQIILLGTVASKADSDMAFIQCNTVSGAFKVFNLLQVRDKEKKA